MIAVGLEPPLLFSYNPCDPRVFTFSLRKSPAARSSPLLYCILEHIDLLLRYFTSRMAARIPDTPKPNNTDEAETNLFDDSHFDQLLEQGIIKSASFSQDAIPESDHHRDTTQQTINIHQLELEQAPRLRVLFQQSKEDVHITLTAEQAEELHIEIPGAPSILGTMHSRAEISCSCKARRIEFTLFYLP